MSALTYTELREIAAEAQRTRVGTFANDLAMDNYHDAFTPTKALILLARIDALETQLAEVAEGRREYQHRALMAEERIEEALALHKNVGGECNECIQVDEYELVEGKRWPCLTVQALTSETEASDE